MDKCIKVNDIKYKTRKSPPFHANECQDIIKKGNDNKLYISKKDKNGIYKWILHDINLPTENPNLKKNINNIILGKDNKTEYVSKEGLDGKYHWEKIKIKYYNNPDDYYKQFPNYVKPKKSTKFITDKIKDLKADLKKIDIILFYNKWSKKYLTSFELEYYNEDVIGTYPPKTNWIYISDRRLYLHSQNHDEVMIPYFISKKNIEPFNDIFEKYFPNKTKGIIKSSKAITIKL